METCHRSLRSKEILESQTNFNKVQSTRSMQRSIIRKIKTTKRLNILGCWISSQFNKSPSGLIPIFQHLPKWTFLPIGTVLTTYLTHSYSSLFDNMVPSIFPIPNLQNLSKFSIFLCSVAFMPFTKPLGITLTVLSHDTFCALRVCFYNYILTIKPYSFYFMNNITLLCVHTSTLILKLYLKLS